MKFKLIQLGILFVFVMSAVFMAQSPSGFGHEAGENHTIMDHNPEFWVHDVTGKSLGNNRENHPDAKDPRKEEHRDYSDNVRENDGKSCSSWALRY